jgi:putative NIF3 family GTP cyclohydrolase 1 type 2
MRELVERLKRALGADRALVAGELDAEVTRVAVCAGSGGDFVKDAVRAGAQVLVTGEVRHHDALAALRAGLCVICLRHSVSERAALAPLGARLGAMLPGVTFLESKEDRDPLAFA